MLVAKSRPSCMYDSVEHTRLVVYQVGQYKYYTSIYVGITIWTVLTKTIHVEIH